MKKTIILLIFITITTLCIADINFDFQLGYLANQLKNYNYIANEQQLLSTFSFEYDLYCLYISGGIGCFFNQREIFHYNPKNMFFPLSLGIKFSTSLIDLFIYYKHVCIHPIVCYNYVIAESYTNTTYIEDLMIYFEGSNNSIVIENFFQVDKNLKIGLQFEYFYNSCFIINQEFPTTKQYFLASINLKHISKYINIILELQYQSLFNLINRISTVEYNLNQYTKFGIEYSVYDRFAYENNIKANISQVYFYIKLNNLGIIL